MEDNLCSGLSFAQVCRFSAQSATNLKTIFKAATGMGVMEYYRMLKIEYAKRLLREGSGNITQIADRARLRVGTLFLPPLQAGYRHDPQRIYPVHPGEIAWRQMTEKRLGP